MRSPLHVLTRITGVALASGLALGILILFVAQSDLCGATELGAILTVAEITLACLLGKAAWEELKSDPHRPPLQTDKGICLLCLIGFAALLAGGAAEPAPQRERALPRSVARQASRENELPNLASRRDSGGPPHVQRPARVDVAAEASVPQEGGVPKRRLLAVFLYVMGGLFIAYAILQSLSPTGRHERPREDIGLPS